MPNEPNKPLRVLVPLVVLAVGVLIVIGVIRGAAPGNPAAPPTGGQTQSQTEDQTEGQPDGQAEQAETDQRPEPADAPAGDEASESPTTDEPPAGARSLPPAQDPAGLSDPQATEGGPSEDAADAAEDQPAPQTDLRARLFPAPAEPPSSLGSADPDGDYRLRLTFTTAGAGVDSITLANYAATLDSERRYPVQSEARLEDASGRDVRVASLAARAAIVNGVAIDLFSAADGSIWRQTAPGAFEAFIETGAGEAVARIDKRYVVRPDTYDIVIDQRLVNLTDRPLTVQWVQYGPVDLPEDESSYLRDVRRVWFAHLMPTERDPSRQFVEREDFRSLQSVLDSPLEPSGLVWPRENLAEDQRLVWTAMTNRYFIFAVHAGVDAAALQDGRPVDKSLDLAQRVYRVVPQGQDPQNPQRRRAVLQINSPEYAVDAGEALDLGFSAYAGPLARKILKQDPVYTAISLDDAIVYNIGGPCAWCTFQPLAKGLIWFLSLFHDYIVHDWALAIMILVVFVRGVLHPITKRSQIRMQRFSKQMAGLAPKQKKLQEKYKDDPKRMQAEMAKLMREEGIDFTGALGCLPMFLQSPIWIALYAMLFFAFELRHEAAFFGLFQQVSGGSWAFLADLSAPDRFIDFGRTIVTLPLLGEISSINILPAVLGVVFFIQQKYLTPPPTTAMSPEQQTQQKIMKVMLVVFFPLAIYQAPSGLSVYFITNSALGIAESRYIRAHIKNLPEPEPKKKKPRPPMGKRVVADKPRSFKQRNKKK